MKNKVLIKSIINPKNKKSTINAIHKYPIHDHEIAKASNPCLSVYLIIAGAKIIKARKDINKSFDFMLKVIIDLNFI
ncbi:MAG: hypothetical protein N2647_01845 [Thermodesulfovibrio sp.]|nr:hypothetical protein [Thermodesulfovibrio sp.]